MVCHDVETCSFIDGEVQDQDVIGKVLFLPKRVLDRSYRVLTQQVCQSMLENEGRSSTQETGRVRARINNLEIGASSRKEQTVGLNR